MKVISLPFPEAAVSKVPSHCALHQSVLEKSWIAYVKKKKIFLNFILFETLFLGGWVTLANPLAVRILFSLWASGVLIFQVSPPNCHVQVVSSRPVRWAPCRFLACLYSPPTGEREPHSATVLILNIDKWHFEIKNQSLHDQTYLTLLNEVHFLHRAIQTLLTVFVVDSRQIKHRAHRKNNMGSESGCGV